MNLKTYTTISLFLISSLGVFLNAQSIRFSAPSYESFACFGSDVHFDTKLECPVAVDCFAVVDYGDSNSPNNDTVQITDKIRHLYSNDGSYDVSISLLSKADSSVIITEKKSGIIKIYDPTGASIFADSADGKSYIQNIKIEDFKPFDTTAWTYTWTFDDDNTTYQTDTLSAVYKKLYPNENYTTGYLVKLKVQLDEFSEAASFIDNPSECFDTVSTFVEVVDNFFENPREDLGQRIPNLFNVITPDGDPNDSQNANDVFIVTTNGVDVFTINIYNNWGNVVFTQTGKDITWTGVNNSGKRVNSGSYYYAITSNVSGDKHTATGFIHVFNEDL